MQHLLRIKGRINEDKIVQYLHFSLGPKNVAIFFAGEILVFWDFLYSKSFANHKLRVVVEKQNENEALYFCLKKNVISAFCLSVDRKVN